MHPATLTQIANLFGVTPRYINILANEKGFPRAERGKYHVVECVRWYIQYLKDKIEAARRGGDERISAEIRRKRAEAALLEIKLARERGDAIRVEDVRREIEPVVAAIKSKLIGIPKHAARELDNKEIEQYLDNFIRKCLDDLAAIQDRYTGLGKASSTSNTGDAIDLPAAAEIDHKRMGRQKPRPQSRSQRRKRPVGHGKS